MNNPNYIQIIVLLLFVGFSVISWVFRKLQEQAQIRRVQLERERRQLEVLRTGKPGEGELPPVATGSDADRLRDLAARRQAQLQELRRRAQERVRTGQGQPGQPPREPPPLVFIPGASGPTVPQRPAQRPQQVRARTPQPPARPQAPVRPGRPAPVQDPRRRQPQPTRRRPEERRISPPAQASPVPAPRPELAVPSVLPGPSAAPVARAPRGPVAATSLDARRMSAEDWRRAIVMNEVLAAPLALREPSPSPGLPPL